MNRASDASAPHGSQRRWSAQIAAAALTVQALTYLGATLYAVALVDWNLPVEELLALDEAYRAALTVLVLGPIIFTLLITVLLVLVRPALGWTVAQFIQTVLLLIGVQLYFADTDQALLLPALLRDLPDGGMALLEDTLSHWRTNARLLQVMIGWWLEQPPSRGAVSLPTTFSQSLYDVLMHQRNLAWRETLLALPPGRYVVAVGALHLYGEGNLPDMLT